jgi:cobaltochelatase CobT
MQKDSILKENIDGEALQWAYKRLLQQKEAKKILIVISDGTPVDDATINLNGKDFLKNHLLEVVSQIETSKKINLLAIGIMHDVTKFYSNATRIDKVEELSQTLFTNLSRML